MLDRISGRFGLYMAAAVMTVAIVGLHIDSSNKPNHDSFTNGIIFTKSTRFWREHRLVCTAKQGYEGM